MIIKLTPADVTICNFIGNMRSLIARNANVFDAKMGNQNGMDSDVMGVKAEFAVAKHFNTFPDLGLSPRSGSCDGVIQGYRYDVKSTHHANGRLLSTLKVNPDVDMYILAVVKNDSVDIKGYALKEHLIKDENIKDLGYGSGYCLEQSKLRKFKENPSIRQ